MRIDPEVGLDPIRTRPQEGCTPVSEALTSIPSRREKHKARTRQALREAALQLFASQGYDSTTADEIAEQVGVSARTFFRYFATKESALFIGRHDWIESFGAMYLDQPAGLTDVEALLASYVLVAPQLTALAERSSCTNEPSRRRPHCAGANRTTGKPTWPGWRVRLRRAGARGDRRGLSPACLGELLDPPHALDNWLAGPASASLADTITDEFERLARFFPTHVETQLGDRALSWS